MQTEHSFDKVRRVQGGRAKTVTPAMWRGGRVAEGARLESVYGRNLIEGSNPSLSATLLRLGALCALMASLIATIPTASSRALGWETFSAEIIPSNRISLGVSLYEGRNIQGLLINEEPFSGRKANIPQVQTNLALGHRAEAILGYTLWRSIEDDIRAESNGGDPWFYTKLQLWSGQSWLPTTSFIWGVLEPAANPPLAADNLAFYAFLAFSHGFDAAPSQPVRLDINIGTGIYESKVKPGQDDIFKFNAALWWLPENSPWQWGVEFNRDQEVAGRWFDFTQGIESQYRRERIALTGHYELSPAWSAQGVASYGLVSSSEDWGVALQLHYQWP